MCNYWYPLANTHGNRTCPTLLDCFVSRTPPLKVRYVSIALPLLTLQECNQGIYHILDGGLNTSHKNNSKCTRPQPPPARDGKLKSLYLRPSTAIYACRACTCYIYICDMYRGKERERERAREWDEQHGTTNRSSHSVTLSEWLHFRCLLSIPLDREALTSWDVQLFAKLLGSFQGEK